MKENVRVRFAPSPSGFMHLGNVRSALINYLFAQQKKGIFLLRIEDTDQQRNSDPEAQFIIKDLNWLALEYNEGPLKGGPYEPYYQSKRTALYEEYRAQCEKRGLIYRCFCTSEELEKRRQRQLALNQPPRYNRQCLALSEREIQQKLESHVPFIWRFKLDDTKTVSFYDLAHKMMHFELKHFSDTPITRQDGSFTFLFSNFIDDKEMRITHVFRGEDHLSNTATQVAFYEAFSTEVPVFWHLPIIGNKEGKKLSKRDFGFSLTDLRTAGYLPEAIVNYLGIIGHSVEEEIMSLERLGETFDFEHISTTGQIRYDLEKLRWMNHEWIKQYNTSKLAELCRPYLEEAYPLFKEMSPEELHTLIAFVQPELITLKDSVEVLEFFVTSPSFNPKELELYGLSNYQPFLQELFKELFKALEEKKPIYPIIQEFCKAKTIPPKNIFLLLRIALTGKTKGLSIQDLQQILTSQEIKNRLLKLLVS